MPDTGDCHPLPEPDIPALLAWGERPEASATDRPHIDVWMPRQTPYAILQTVTVGPPGDRREVLNNAPRALVNLHLAGVVIGGFLDDMEVYLDAARDALRLARYYADVIEAREQGNGSSSGVSGG